MKRVLDCLNTAFYYKYEKRVSFSSKMEMSQALAYNVRKNCVFAYVIAFLK